MLTTKRMREHAALFASLLGVVAIVCGLGIGLTGLLASAATDGVRADLASRTGTAAGLEISFPLATDAAEQDAAVRDAITVAFQSGDRTVPFAVSRSVSTLGSALPFVRLDADGQVADLGPEEDPADPDTDGRTVVMSLPDLPERAELVEGRWPTAPTEVSVQADGAALLSLALGDRILIGTADLEVTGLWRVTDPLDPRWLGDQLITSGADSDDAGVVVIDEQVWPAAGVTPWGRWTLVPVVDEFVVADLDTIERVWNDLTATIQATTDLSTTSLNRDGNLARTAVNILSRVHALEAVQPIALLIIGAIAVIALLELARLLAGVRSGETELLWSRGASARDLMTSTALEAAVAAVLGALLGIGGATAALWLASGHPDAVTSAGTALWAVPLAAVVGAVGVFAFTAYRAGRRPLGRDTATVSGRARSIAGLGGVVLVVVAAGISVWQLMLYGSPLTPTATGELEVDPIAVLAPALALVAIVLAGLVAFPRVAPIVERAARGSTGAQGVLAARSVARRLQFAATPIVLVALACGQLVIGAGYATTWSTAYDQTTELRAGSEVRVLVGRGGIPEARFDSIAAVEGVTTVAPVQVMNSAIADNYASVVAATPLTFAQLANDAGGVLDPAVLAENIAAVPDAPQLAGDASGLTIELGTQGFDVAPELLVRVVSALGRSLSLPLEAAGETTDETSEAFITDGERTWAYEAELPGTGTEGGWRVIGLDVTVQPGELPRVLLLASIASTGGSASGEVDLDAAWVGRAFMREIEALPPIADRIGFTVPPGAALLRLVPAFGGTVADALTPRIVISESLAQRYSFEVGDTVPIGILDSQVRIPCLITGIVPGVPAATSEVAIAIDVATVDGLVLRTEDVPDAPHQVWIGSDDPTAVAVALRAALPPQLRVEAIAIDPARVMLGSAVTALWIGAIGSVLLAVVAVSTVAGAQLRSRRGEVIILRAVGLGSRSLAAIRRRELLFVLGYGGLLGLIAGTTVTALVLSSLARAAVPAPFASLPTEVRLDLPLLALALAGFAALLAIVVAAYGMRVATQARTLSAREEVR